MRLSKIQTYRALVLIAGLALGRAIHAETEWRFSGVDRVVAIGDIHGAYDAFERILLRAGLIDSSHAWTGGHTHLVIDGDTLDRGPGSRKALDLIMALEPEALAAGGQVHFVLGNHEVMNLTGDRRYVSNAGYAAFADEEPAEEREAAFERYRRTLDGPVNTARARRMFDEAYPMGFFARGDAFSPEGVYGAWLLQQPVILVIGDTVFVHGGLSETVIAYGERLNSELHQQLVEYVTALETLIDAGALSRMDDFYDQPDHLGEVRADGAVGAAAARLRELHEAVLFSPDSPIWYRGNVGCNRLTEQDRLGQALEGLGARRLVIGHTPTRSGLVLSRMDESVLRVDTGMLHDYYGGRASALIIENGTLSVLYEDESTPSVPLEQPRHVGLRPAGFTADTLEDFLRHADVKSRQKREGDTSLLTLEQGDTELQGLFIPAERRQVLPPVAAYRLDRLLGLDMVPVTVVREIDGVEGALQFWPPRTISESERSSERLGASAWCPLEDQIADMYRFDSLTFDQGRTADSIRYSTEDFELLLVGSNRSFTTDSGRPAYLDRVPVELTGAWKAALGDLDEASLTGALGDVLDRRRIRALLERRDFLLDASK